MKKVILALGVVFLFAACKKDVPQKQLTVNVTPEVGGSVTPSSGTYAMGSTVKLTATPSAEYIFKEWTGGFTGTTNPANVIMDLDKTVTAVFEKREYPLSFTIVGSGTVKEEIIKIASSATNYKSGTTVRLTPQPSAGFQFKKWSGDDTSSKSPLDIVVSKPINLTCTFEKLALPSISTNVYVGGNVSMVPNTIAMLWNNNSPTKLPDFNTTSGANVSSIAVSGSDVYAVGNGIYIGNSYPIVWKNGIKLDLLVLGGYIKNLNTIFINGNDIYYGGSARNTNTGSSDYYPVIWKNNVRTYLSNSSGSIGSIAISGNILYALEGQGGRRFWKNGVENNLDGQGYSIFASGTDIYISGVSSYNGNDVPTIWKNGVKIILSNYGLYGQAKSIFVNGSDVYVVGSGNGSPILWKNGVALKLEMSSATSVFVKGSDVFISGSTLPDKSYGLNYPCIWKNGTVNLLYTSSFKNPDGSFFNTISKGIANTIFVSN
jgi:hypothetical protein